jgi:hypothetical protein
MLRPGKDRQRAVMIAVAQRWKVRGRSANGLTETGLVACLNIGRFIDDLIVMICGVRAIYEAR